MATQNKTTENKTSVKDFLNTIADEAKRKDCIRITEIFEKESGYEAKMWGTAIIGFGTVHYKYDSGREGDMPIVGFSPRKAANVLYGAIGFDGAETLLDKLGKHTTGKGCLYIKKLADVDMKALEALLEKAVAATRARHAEQA